MLTETTKQFLNLILEEEDTEKPAEKPADPTADFKLLRTNTDNKLSKGRPIKDAGLANMKYRSNASPDDAKQMLSDLEISKPSASTWHGALSELLNDATSGELGAVFKGATVVKSPSKKVGVVLSLEPVWEQDDKGGKRTFGFIRAVVMGATRAGFLSVDPTIFKNLRVERVEGKNAFIIYPSNKAMSWMQ